MKAEGSDRVGRDNGAMFGFIASAHLREGQSSLQVKATRAETHRRGTDMLTHFLHPTPLLPTILCPPPTRDCLSGNRFSCPHFTSSPACLLPVLPGDDGGPLGRGPSLQGPQPNHRRQEGQRQPGLPGGQASGDAAR